MYTINNGSGKCYNQSAGVTTILNFGPSTLTGIEGQATMNVVGNIYISNAVTTTDVFATRYYGDAGFLSNILASSIVQPFANLVVSNAVTTTNVFAETETLTGSADNTTLNVTGNVYVSNAVTTTNVFASSFIGIGTDVPQASLDVRTSCLVGDFSGGGFYNSNGALQIRRSGVNPHLIVENIGVSTGAIVGISDGMVIGTDASGVIAFRTGCNTSDDFSSTGTESMRINTTGVGIGTTAPTANLHVVGNVYASTSITGTRVIGTHYGVIAGSNTIAASSITASGTSNFNARLNMNSTFELGALSGVARNILWGTSSTSSVNPGPINDNITFPTALSGTSYVVFMTPRYGSNQTIFTATINTKLTTRFDFYAYRITGTGTTANWDWMVIDYN
jgi:hypothetical protein